MNVLFKLLYSPASIVQPSDLVWAPPQLIYLEIIHRSCLPFSASGNASNFYLTFISCFVKRRKLLLLNGLLYIDAVSKAAETLAFIAINCSTRTPSDSYYIRWINGLLLAESHLAVSIDRPNALHLNSTNITVCLQYTLYPESIHQQKNSPFLLP